MSTRLKIPVPPRDDRVRVTFEIDQDTWDLLQEVADGDDWHEVAAKALEAGLEQARTPTISGYPSHLRQP